MRNIKYFTANLLRRNQRVPAQFLPTLSVLPSTRSRGLCICLAYSTWVRKGFFWLPNVRAFFMWVPKKKKTKIYLWHIFLTIIVTWIDLLAIINCQAVPGSGGRPPMVTKIIFSSRKKSRKLLPTVRGMGKFSAFRVHLAERRLHHSERYSDRYTDTYI